VATTRALPKSRQSWAWLGWYAGWLLWFLSLCLTRHFLPCRLVYGLGSAALPLVRSIGSIGSGAFPGQAPQFNGTSLLCLAPWSSTTVLVADRGNNRVQEVDFVSGTLVRVVVSGIEAPVGVATTRTVLAVSHAAGGLQETVLFSAVSGTRLVSVPAGSAVPYGLRFSQDGAALLVVEQGSSRVTRWRAGDGVFQGVVACRAAVEGRALCVGPPTLKAAGGATQEEVGVTGDACTVVCAAAARRHCALDTAMAIPAHTRRALLITGTNSASRPTA
jgi:hypothetical protein